MSIFDKVKDAVSDKADQAEDVAKSGIDKAAGMADEKTGGKLSEHIDKAADAATNAADKIDGKEG